LTGLQLAAPFGPTVPSLNLLQSHVFFGAILLVGVLLLELSARRKPLSDTSNSAKNLQLDPGQVS
jgi:hypothetical protein